MPHGICWHSCDVMLPIKEEYREGDKIEMGYLKHGLQRLIWSCITLIHVHGEQYTFLGQ